jgi:hypothetical protein
MSIPNINAELTDADVLAIKTALETIFAKLPFLVDISATENEELYKMGPDAKPYVDKTKNYTDTYPVFIPQFKSKDDFLSNHKLWEQLAIFFQQTNGLSKGLEETMRVIGSQMMFFMKGYYNTAKEGVDQGAVGAGIVVADLGEFYDRPDRPGDIPSET